MPQQLCYPGVYIQEIPSGVRSIAGVSTSITAFVGRALRGPDETQVRVQSFAQYSRIFGGLWQPSTMSYAVNQFFQHGGGDALIVRVTKAADSANKALKFGAVNEGVWADEVNIESLPNLLNQNAYWIQ